MLGDKTHKRKMQWFFYYWLMAMKLMVMKGY